MLMPSNINNNNSSVQRNSNSIKMIVQNQYR